MREQRHSLNCFSIILHILHMKQNRKMIMSRAACFHCCFFVFRTFHVRFQRTLSPNCLKYRWFDLFAVFTCSQSTFVLWIKFPLLIMKEVASLTLWIHCWINFTPPATDSQFYLYKRGATQYILEPHSRSSFLDTANKKTLNCPHIKKASPLFKCVFLMCEVLIQCAHIIGL